MFSEIDAKTGVCRNVALLIDFGFGLEKIQKAGGRIPHLHGRESQTDSGTPFDAEANPVELRPPEIEADDVQHTDPSAR